MSASRKKRKEVYNEDWETEIAAYDAECKAREKEFYKTHLVIKDSVISDLTAEEHDVFGQILKGASCSEIAEKFCVDVEVITGLMEIIRAKLSLSDS